VATDVADLILVRLAHVEDVNIVAAVQPGFQLARFVLL
jgi:hypothetical protein